MIRGMTGFVTKRRVLSGLGPVNISLRSVNYKYLDVHISRIPWTFEGFEKYFHEDIIKKIRRGRVDISLALEAENGTSLSTKSKREIKKLFNKSLSELIEFKTIQGKAIQAQIEEITINLIKRAGFFKERAKKIADDQPESAKDIFEEITLSAFYLQHLKKILKRQKGEFGKILDFLSQELLRETNTILAKNKDKRLSLEAIYFKEEVSRLRELSQNIE